MHVMGWAMQLDGSASPCRVNILVSTLHRKGIAVFSVFVVGVPVMSLFVSAPDCCCAVPLSALKGCHTFMLISQHLQYSAPSWIEIDNTE